MEPGRLEYNIYMTHVIPAHIIAVGSLKKGPEYDLFQHYKKRLKNITVSEIKPASSKDEEGVRILSSLSNNTYIIGLDEKGVDYDSVQLAHFLGQTLQYVRSITFIIGGADGLSSDLKKRCHMLLRFGALTWPHMMVRGMVCEQIYRATSILNQHPYHRV